MTLRRKFGILMALLASTAAVTLGTAAWSFLLLERESSATLRGLPETLSSIRLTREAFAALGDAAMPPVNGQTLVEATEKVRGRLEILERLEGRSRVAGESAWRSLRERASRAMAAANNQGSVEEIKQATSEASLVLARIERRLFVESNLAIESLASMRRRLFVALGVSGALATLICALGYLLLTRWVSKPITQLHEAAVRIGSGDFEHRIETEGRDELAQLSREINHMASTVSSLQDERVRRERLAAIGEMVRRLAHNLRNPLAGIRSLAELTRDEPALGADASENQNRIISTVDRFEQWLSDLLRATAPLRIEPRLQPVHSWLASVVETHRPVAESRSVELQANTEEVLAPASYDAAHLEQALVAILTNAIEVSPAGSAVRIAARCCDDDPQWEIEIEDEGPGVPDELRERIFAPQFTTKATGNGIGLAMANEVVRGHGGRIIVESSGAQGVDSSKPSSSGARFIVRLPRLQLSPRAADSQE